MHQLRALLTTLVAVVCLSSCASKRFYSKVDGSGVIRGRPSIDWVKPERFVYDRRKNQVFEFRRSNGEVIRPGTIETDGGSIPRVLWNKNGYSPWTYAPAYLIHDWLYEAHRRKEPGGVSADGKPLFYQKDTADYIMAEVIKTQMEHQDIYSTKKSPARMRAIYLAVNYLGNPAWNGQAHPVPEETVLTPVFDNTVKNLPLMPALKMLTTELTPTPAPQDLSGSTSYKN